MPGCLQPRAIGLRAKLTDKQYILTRRLGTAVEPATNVGLGHRARVPAVRVVLLRQERHQGPELIAVKLTVAVLVKALELRVRRRRADAARRALCAARVPPARELGLRDRADTSRVDLHRGSSTALACEARHTQRGCAPGRRARPP